jgi:hypothetical protein
VTKLEGGSWKAEVEAEHRARLALYFGSSSALRRSDFPKVSGAGRLTAGVYSGGAGATPAARNGTPQTVIS